MRAPAGRRDGPTWALTDLVGIAGSTRCVTGNLTLRENRLDGARSSWLYGVRTPREAMIRRRTLVAAPGGEPQRNRPWTNDGKG